MERRSFPYEEDRWRADNLTGVSVTMGGKTVRLGDETACCEGGGDVVVVIVAVIGFAGGKKRKAKNRGKRLMIARHREIQGNINSGRRWWLGVHPRFASRSPAHTLCNIQYTGSRSETAEFHKYVWPG